MSSLEFSRHGPAEQGFVDGRDKTRIHYEIWSPPEGHPPLATLVLSDGIGCDGYVWKYFVRRFEGRYRIIHWQYRGHGKSGLPRDRTHTTFDDICGDLEAVLAGTQTTSCILVGHSMGVQVCLEYQRRHPEVVRALVLICGSHGFPLDTVHNTRILKTVVPAALKIAERFPMLSSALWHAAISSELAYQVATRLEVNGHLVARADFHPYFDHLAGMDPQLFLAMLNNAGAHSASAWLPEIRIPTLVVAGTDDGFTPFWLSEEMHERIPGSEMLTVPGGTHTAPLEQPELIELRIEKFFAEHPIEAAKTPPHIAMA